MLVDHKSISIWKVALLCTIGIFFINAILPSWTNGFPDGLNMSLDRLVSNQNADDRYHLQLSHSEFARRPVVTGMQGALHNIGVPYQLSFNIINYVALFCMFILVGKFTGPIHGSLNASRLIVFIALSFSILFAFLGGIHTHDDIIQYNLILVFLMTLSRQRYLLGAFVLGLACITRETSLLFVPVLLLHMINTKRSIIEMMYLGVLVIFIYFIWLFSMTTEMVQASKEFLINKRFYAWQSNFGSIMHLKETVTAIYMTLGFLAIVLIKRAKEYMRNPKTRFWIISSIYLFLANTVLVCISATAKEARLLFLPVIVATPLLARELPVLIRYIYVVCSNFRLLTTIIGFSLVSGIFLHSSTLGGTGYVFKAYFIIFTIFFLAYTFNPEYRLQNRG